MVNNKVVVVGSYNTDLTIKTERIPRPGETVIGGIFSEGGGGKGANQAVAAARAGAGVTLVARVGDDLLGKAGIERLTKEGIDTRMIVRDRTLSTGVAFIVVDEHGENSIVVASGANAHLGPDDIDAASDEIRSADVVLLQLESPLETVRAAIGAARQGGALTILNPAPARPLERVMLEQIDIITPNKVEAEMLTGVRLTDEESMRAIAEKLFSLGVRTVVITLGAKGVFVGKPEKMELIAPYAVRAVDSTGAGDVFSGSLAAFLSEGMTIPDAARMANASASISVTRLGAQDSAPRRAEIEEFIASYGQVTNMDMHTY